MITVEKDNKSAPMDDLIIEINEGATYVIPIHKKVHETAKAYLLACTEGNFWIPKKAAELSSTFVKVKAWATLNLVD